MTTDTNMVPGDDERDDDHEAGTMVVKVSGDGNGLVDDEASGKGPSQPMPHDNRKTANEINGGEGDADATSQ